MMEFGNTLRNAREAKGFTQAQIAEMTRMAPTTVAELEEENFSRIAAPIYGRGFVKLYCQAVGIDPRPLVEEFMAIYSGERETGIRERIPQEQPPKQEPPPKQEQPPKQEPPPRQEPLFQREPEPRQEPKVEPAPPEPSGAEPPAVEPQVSRYAAPMRPERERGPAIPPSFWRICALVAVSALLFWGIVAGIRALYRATTSDRPSAAPAKEVVASAAPKNEKGTPRSPAADIRREPQKIPSLYMD